MTARLSSILSALLLACALFPEPTEAQVLRRVVDSLEIGRRAVIEVRARSDRTIEVAVRASDGSTEVVSAAIPDNAENWTNALSAWLAGEVPRAKTDELLLHEALLVTVSDSVRNAFVLFVSDTAFAQLGVTLAPDELRDFGNLLHAASTVAAHLPLADFSTSIPLKPTDVEPVANTLEARYPEALRGPGVEGEVHAQFVVDRAGRVEQESVKILSATRREFGDAVRAKLNTARFIPASVSGYPFRRITTMRFVFNIEN